MKYSKTILSVTVVSLSIASASAATWPERPVSIVVPFKAGGSSDLVARSFAAAINEQQLLSEPLNVVNVGGHSSVGARRVMDAKPDGYEFLVHETGLIGAQAAGITNFGYEDFKPIALTGENCMAILVRKDSGYDSLQALLTAAADKSNPVVFGVNIGGLNHMSGIMLENHSDADFRFAQVGGSADNFAALTGGQIAVASVGAAGAKNFTLTDDGQLADDSQVKAIALLDDESDDRLPGVPTAKSQGTDVSFCFGNYWLAPKDTPDEVVDAFADALEAASQSDRIKTYYDDTLTKPIFLRGEAFREYLDEQTDIVGPVAKQATAG